MFPQQFVNARLEVEAKRAVTLAPTRPCSGARRGTFAYVVKPTTR